MIREVWRPTCPHGTKHKTRLGNNSVSAILSCPHVILASDGNAAVIRLKGPIKARRGATGCWRRGGGDQSSQNVD